MEHRITSPSDLLKLHKAGSINVGDTLHVAYRCGIAHSEEFYEQAPGRDEELLVLATYSRSNSYQVLDKATNDEQRVYTTKEDYYISRRAEGYEQQADAFTAAGPEVSDQELIQQAQLTLVQSTVLRITRPLNVKGFSAGYRPGMSGASNGRTYWTAYNSRRADFMVYIAELGYFHAEAMDEQNRQAMLLRLIPPVLQLPYEVNCGYGDKRPSYFFDTLDAAVAHARAEVQNQTWTVEEVERGLDCPGQEFRVRGSGGLRWIKKLDTPVPADAPEPKFNLGAQVKCLGQMGWLTVQKREYDKAGWHYAIDQRVDPLTSERRVVTAHESNLGGVGEADPNAKYDSPKGNKAELAATLDSFNVTRVEKTDEEIERFSRSFYHGTLRTASGALEAGRHWDGWRTLKNLLAERSQVEYWVSPNYDLLTYTTYSGSHRVVFKGYSILDARAELPPLSKVLVA